MKNETPESSINSFSDLLKKLTSKYCQDHLPQGKACWLCGSNFADVMRWMVIRVHYNWNGYWLREHNAYSERCKNDVSPKWPRELSHCVFRCDIPVIVMGETGCGKTRLVKFLCALQTPRRKDINTMVLVKVMRTYCFLLCAVCVSECYFANKEATGEEKDWSCWGAEEATGEEKD